MAFIKENNLSGAFLWSVDLDDFTGEWCEQGRFPLASAIKSFLKPSTTSLLSCSKMNKINFFKLFNFLFISILFKKKLK
jgi:hypothetical protein